MKHAIVITILLLLAAPSWAEDGAVPVYEPVVISSSGRYVVTRAFSGANPIQVAVDDVDIDLNGFTLTSTSGAVVAIADGVTDVSIHDGHLTGGSDGIVYLSAVASRLRVRNVDIDATGYGIRVATAAKEVTIAGCNIVGVSQDGIYLETLIGVPSTFSVTDTRVTSVAAAGIHAVGFGSGEVSHCSVVDYGAGAGNVAGIWLEQSDLVLVFSNTVAGDAAGGGDGIRVNYGSRVTENAVFDLPGDFGITNFSSAVIDQNLVDNAAVPIFAQGFYSDVLENSVQGADPTSALGCDITGAAVARDNNLWYGVPKYRICGSGFTYQIGDNAQ